VPARGPYPGRSLRCKQPHLRRPAGGTFGLQVEPGLSFSRDGALFRSVYWDPIRQA
jgi:hypothetical protein